MTQTVCSTRCKMLRKTLLLAVFITLAVSFFQNDYYLQYEKHFINFTNKDYLENVNVTYKFYNHSVKAISGTFDLIRNCGMNIKFKLQTYKFGGYDYRYFPVYYEENPCIALIVDKFGASINKFNTNILSCPLKKGHYYVYNAVLNQSRLPPHAPRGQFMFDSEIYENNILIMRTQVFVKVVPTNPSEIARNYF